MTTPPRAADAARRPLPAGAGDEHHRLFIPPPIRTFYLTVTAPPGVSDPPATEDDAAAILDAACDWCEDYARTVRRMPGTGRRLPPPPPPDWYR